MDIKNRNYYFYIIYIEFKIIYFEYNNWRTSYKILLLNLFNIIVLY